MIESVHVKGFRSLADFKVEDLPNPTVMIGPNGTGKSNVFRWSSPTNAFASAIATSRAIRRRRTHLRPLPHQ